MKLVYCPMCQDLYKMPVATKSKSCMCGLSWGRYLKDKKHAVIGGFAIPVGIDNKSFVKAIKKRHELLYFSIPHPFEAFLIPKICTTVKNEITYRKRPK